MTSTSESLPGSATTSTFSIKLKKNTAGPGVLLYEEVKLDLTDGTHALHRHVTVPSPWGGGNFVYITDAKEGPSRSESSITDDSQSRPQARHRRRQWKSRAVPRSSHARSSLSACNSHRSVS
ncbi:hypothetical protein BKA70DRAFT_1569495 [Coprinopsis sp. MPI-PUGE-AT-0042]|nr:hypothetical protein BKA70DRAFT_1569495 [Coprinopsis sp. MPI-PUGE-AT-0042]